MPDASKTVVQGEIHKLSRMFAPNNIGICPKMLNFEKTYSKRIGLAGLDWNENINRPIKLKHFFTILPSL